MENNPTGTRRYPRIPVEYPLLVEIIGDPNLGGFGVTSVVGLGGCGFIAEEKYGENSNVKLTLSIQGKMVAAEARVIYENRQPDGKWEIGVEFTNISSFDKFAIDSLFGD